MNNYLFLIPARGGSKGIPQKNIQAFCGKPLIYYSLEYARLFTSDDNICITTDSQAIADSVQQIGYQIPFMRPAALATDEAGTFPVLQHALAFYEQQGRQYDAIILLQPTSPIREVQHLKESLQLLEPETDMVVSVVESKANPYYNLFEEQPDGFLHISKKGNPITRRQDAPPVYQYNGSIYIIHTTAMHQYSGFGDFQRIRKYVMDATYTIDLDTAEDWAYAEWKMKKHIGT